MGREPVACERGLSGLMNVQRTATFQTYGIKPNFNDTVKARAKSLQKPVPIAFLRMSLWTLSTPGALPFFSSDRTMREIRANRLHTFTE